MRLQNYKETRKTQKKTVNLFFTKDLQKEPKYPLELLPSEMRE
jgi:hypothetical protein